jgi:KTSC domain
VNWTSVVSRAFSAVAYDEGARQLYVRFHSGKVYRDFEFPPDQYDGLLAAESKGGYFGSHIRGRFRDEEVRETRWHRELSYSSGK